MLRRIALGLGVPLLALVTAASAAPPPWAPAHGYRYRNLDGVVIVYDAHHGLWEVLAIAGLFYMEGRYWRHVHDRWEWSDRYDDGRWHAARPGHEPPALRGWRPPPRHDRDDGRRYDRDYHDDRHDDHGAPPHRGGAGDGAARR